jgi:AcrR family transcriptional regulator
MRMTESKLINPESAHGRLLDAAIQLFGERGFDAVTVRDITAAANANGAAISYHFGTKEELIRQTFAAIVRPINEERLRRLDDVLQEAGSAPPRLEQIIRALLDPVVFPFAESKGAYHRFHILAYALRRPFVDDFFRAEHDAVARKFVAAFSRAIPSASLEDLWWRFDFIIGATVHILLDADRGGRLKQLSGGACETSDPESVTKQLVAFIEAGMRAGSQQIAGGQREK